MVPSLINIVNTNTYLSHGSQGKQTWIDLSLNEQSQNILYLLAENEDVASVHIYNARLREGSGFQDWKINIGKFKTHMQLSVIPDLYVEWLICCFY